MIDLIFSPNDRPQDVDGILERARGARGLRDHAQGDERHRRPRVEAVVLNEHHVDFEAPLRIARLSRADRLGGRPPTDGRLAVRRGVPSPPTAPPRGRRAETTPRSRLRRLEERFPLRQQPVEFETRRAVLVDECCVAPVLASFCSSSARSRLGPLHVQLDEFELVGFAFAGRRRPLAFRPRRGRRRRRLPPPARRRSRPSRRRTSETSRSSTASSRSGDGVEQRAVVRDEQHRPGERLERGLERLARSRGRGGSSARRARGSSRREATTIASASRRRSPPESAATGFSCSSQPEKRKRPSSACASGRFSPVPRHRRVEHRAALVELGLVLREVRGLDAVAEPDASRRPARGGRGSSRAASSCPSRSARRARRARRARSRTTRRRAAACRPPRSDSPSATTTSRPERAGFRNSKPSVRRAASGALHALRP